MPKYRLLTRDELESMRDDFVKYLVLNGIDIDEWMRLKKEEPKKADKILDLFSDVVFERVLRRIEYVDLYTQRTIKAFKCEEDKMILIALETEDESYDFTQPAGIQKARETPPADLKIYRTEKKYTDTRELEIYLMTTAGATASKGKLYESLEHMLPSR